MTSCWSHPTARLFRSLTSARNGRLVVPVQPASRLPAWKISHYIGQAPSRDQRGAIFLPPSKALFCHSPRASRRIPALFFRAQSIAFNRVDEPAVAGFERRVKHGRKRGGILREARVEFVSFLISGIANGLWNKDDRGVEWWRCGDGRGGAAARSQS